MFPYLPGQPGYNKRLRAALPLVKQVIRDLAADSDFWFDTVWIADSTPVECGRSRPTAKRSDMAGWANYGYCASTPAGSGGCRPEKVAALRRRVAAGLTTTFASHFTDEVSLAGALRPDDIAVYGRLATGKKYLIRPDS